MSVKSSDLNQKNPRMVHLFQSFLIWRFSLNTESPLLKFQTSEMHLANVLKG